MPITMVGGIKKSRHGNLHKRLKEKFGHASKCESENCTHDNPKRFEWALRKGCEYSSDAKDYIQLCCSCHRKYDFNEGIRQKLKAKKYGDKHNAAKLTNEQVLEIKDLILSGQRVDLIAEKYGMHPTTISNIKTGKRWNYLTNLK